MYDLIIVGGGPAGLTAGIYARRKKLKTLLITKNIGGQALAARKIENYPGFLEISGFELIKKFQKQAINSGIEVVFDEVIRITEKNGKFFVKTLKSRYEGKAIILAFGKTPKTLGVKGEKEFLGKGVSYCAICDMPLFKDKIIAIIGEGNSALSSALYGSEIAKKVYLINRGEEFRGSKDLVEKVKKKKNIEIVFNATIKEIKGKEFVNSLIIKNILTGEEKEIEVRGVFVEIGYEVKTDWVRNLVKLDEKNQIITNKKCETFYPDTNKVRPGIFAAGDVTNTQFKQIITAAGEGAKAALQAYIYLKR